MIIAPRWLSIISYPTRARGIIVKYARAWYWRSRNTPLLHCTQIDHVFFLFLSSHTPPCLIHDTDARNVSRSLSHVLHSKTWF